MGNHDDLEKRPEWTVPAHQTDFAVLEYWPDADEPSLNLYPVIAWSSYGGMVVPVTPDWEANDGIKNAVMYNEGGATRPAFYAVSYPNGSVTVPGDCEWKSVEQWRAWVDKATKLKKEHGIT
jgi:hypothetical protein